MDTPEFDIIFRGDIVLGHQLADVKLRLQQLFKVDAAKVDTLFTGRPIPLKRKLDEVTANKYREVLLKAGAQVVIRPSTASSVNAVAKPIANTVTKPIANTVTKPMRPLSPKAMPLVDASPYAAPEGAWSLAPTGSDLLPANQRPPAVAPVVIDVTGLSLRAQDGNLLDADERKPDPVADVVVPNLEVAEIGATLMDEDLLPLPRIEIELEDWDIAEVGSDLLQEDEREIVVPLVIAPVDYGLAPAGSDLGQLKPQVQLLNPDVSGLRLVDNT